MNNNDDSDKLDELRNSVASFSEKKVKIPNSPSTVLDPY